MLLTYSIVDALRFSQISVRFLLSFVAERIHTTFAMLTLSLVEAKACCMQGCVCAPTHTQTSTRHFINTLAFPFSVTE